MPSDSSGSGFVFMASIVSYALLAIILWKYRFGKKTKPYQEVLKSRYPTTEPKTAYLEDIKNGLPKEKLLCRNYHDNQTFYECLREMYSSPPLS
jgi:hypothetical protein